ncbi:hypothetical protein AB0C29_41330 [Actinoplanes sp. NPDC048791]
MGFRVSGQVAAIVNAAGPPRMPVRRYVRGRAGDGRMTSVA